MCRLFRLLPLNKRLYVVLTELLIAENLFKYFNGITMTFDSVTLQTKLHSNTQKQAHNLFSQFLTVITNTDFAKWNSNMRNEETIRIFKDMDNLFGWLSVISRTHEMFEESTLYLADGTITPIDDHGNWINSEGVWTGHLGGIEGLRQKGWTIITVVLLKYVAELNNVRCQIMGQGDNQVLVLSYPKSHPTPVHQRHAEFIQSLNAQLSHYGPPLKLEETWSSSNVLTYGKVVISLGVPKSTSIKKLCRAARLTNDGVPTLSSTLSSISANVSAATASDNDPIVPFIMGRLETIGALRLNLQCPMYSAQPYELYFHDRLKVPLNGAVNQMQLNLSRYDQRVINTIGVSHLDLLSITPSILGGPSRSMI